MVASGQDRVFSDSVPGPAHGKKRGGIVSQLAFLVALWKANLAAAMEYRVGFLAQVVGMMLNNAVYFAFWIIFFNRFDRIRGWGLEEMFLLFGIVASGFGLGVLLFGNVVQLATVITSGRLDYYLTLPRPVLLHVLASRTMPSGLGDLSYGMLTVLFFGERSLPAFARFGLAVLLSMTVFLSFLILVQALAFWMGNAQMLTGQAINALLVFALYPITLFDGTAKFLLFTIVPAAFVGAVPAEFVSGAEWGTLLRLTVAAAVALAAALGAFGYGLRRYESGSAIAAAT